MKINVKELTLSAMFLALGLVLPFITGNIPAIGKMLSPMHIPVLLCGFLVGWKYGLLIGIITPLLRSVLFGMPAIYNAFAMAFELAIYGACSGLLYERFKDQGLKGIYISLIISMLVGRVVWGIASYFIYSMQGNAFTFQAFLAGAFINAVPAIILQLVLIPFIVSAIEKRQSL